MILNTIKLLRKYIFNSKLVKSAPPLLITNVAGFAYAFEFQGSIRKSLKIINDKNSKNLDQVISTLIYKNIINSYKK